MKRGFSIVEVLVALAVLGVLVGAIAWFFKDTIASQRIAKLKGERTDVRNLLRANLDCDATTAVFAAAGCGGRAEDRALRIDARKLGGGLLANKAEDLRLGASFLVRASCFDFGEAWGVRFDVRARDALGSVGVEFDSWRPLFSEVPFTCRKLVHCDVDTWLFWGKLGPPRAGMSWCSQSMDLSFPANAMNFDVKMDQINSDDSNAFVKLDGVPVWRCPPESFASPPAGTYTHIHPLATPLPLHPGINVFQGKNFDNYGGWCGVMPHLTGSYDAHVTCGMSFPANCQRYDDRCY